MVGKIFKAWAIHTRSSEGHGFIGRYWFGNPLPTHMEGCEVALFTTRKLARENLPSVRGAFTRAQVVRVKVSVFVVLKGEKTATIRVPEKGRD